MLIIRRRYFDENQYWLNNQNKEEAQIASVLKGSVLIFFYDTKNYVKYAQPGFTFIW